MYHMLATLSHTVHNGAMHVTSSDAVPGQFWSHAPSQNAYEKEDNLSVSSYIKKNQCTLRYEPSMYIPVYVTHPLH